MKQDTLCTDTILGDTSGFAFCGHYVFTKSHKTIKIDQLYSLCPLQTFYKNDWAFSFYKL